ncbi:IpaC/SipC family type III secretion system effector [Obesumbacterium proteus]|uniref:IpaC/SipC family type III secretion system effector n=1 Tax=Obesumbacterium proteus TaxID=82983 RepID=UPI00242B3FBC|nr:IpaC/SipC family type III secretion system effector [Obesumbacterium proteus]
MLAIGTASTNSHNYPVSNDVAPKALPQTVGIGLGDIAPVLNKVNALSLSKNSRVPELASPTMALSQGVTDALKTYLQENKDNPDFNHDMGALFAKLEEGVSKVLQSKNKEQLEQGVPFDISGLSPSATALLVAINGFLLSLNTSNRALSSKLSLVSFEASKNTAASMVREGMDALAGSIAQSTLQVGITAVGAKKQHDGLSNERGALKNNAAKLETLNAESRQIRNTLNSHNTTRLAADGDDMMHLETHSSRGTMRQSLNEGSVVSNADASDSLGLQSSNERLSPEHQAVLSRHLETIDADIDVQHRTLEDNKIKARDKQLFGDAIMRSSQAVGSIAGSSGQYSATLERSEQQISQASSRVATTASEDSRESAQGNLSMLQEMLRMIDSINQSKSNTIGSIAGNLRA